jgi:RNA recognition motif-containing protein
MDIILKDKKEKYAFIEFEDIRDAEEALNRLTYKFLSITPVS